MADTAAHLVDRVPPHVPVRQWVLSLSVALRHRLAYDSTLLRDVLQIFVRAVLISRRALRDDFRTLVAADCVSLQQL